MLQCQFIAGIYGESGRATKHLVSGPILVHIYTSASSMVLVHASVLTPGT